MYEISFHLKLYTIIYWTKKYSPKLRFHNKVVYKCKSLSKWWLWACKSTFYLIKKGRICGPCETKHDKTNSLALPCILPVEQNVADNWENLVHHIRSNRQKYIVPIAYQSTDCLFQAVCWCMEATVEERK